MSELAQSTKVERLTYYGEAEGEGEDAEYTGIDEVVANGYVHLEQMSETEYYLGIGAMQTYLTSLTPISIRLLQNEQEIGRVEEVKLIPRDEKGRTEWVRELEPEEVNALLRRMGWNDLLYMIRRVLEGHYPTDIFKGGEGSDPGPAFVAKVREALALLPDPAEGSRREPKEEPR